MSSSGFPGRDGLIVLCAANNYDTVKMADQHMAGELARLAPVLYVDPPLSCLVPLRNRAAISQLRGPRLRMQSATMARLTPLVGPFPTRPNTADITTSLLRGYLRRAIRKMGVRTVQAVISAWPGYPVFGACGEEVTLYWAQDDFVGGAELLGLDAGHLARREQIVAKGADFVVAANPLVAEHWRDSGHETLLIPFGADVSAYANLDSVPVPADVDLPDPVVGFVGHINSRIDIRLLETIAGSGRSLLLVGPKDPAFEPRRIDSLLRLPNVRWVGYKAFGDLPGYFRRIAVGVVPYGDSAFNRGSFPLKTLEYLAAGIPVVSTGLPATRWLATDLIGIADEPRDFADLVERMLATAGDASLAARRREFAAGHTYASRASEFQAAIEKHRPGWQAATTR